MTFTAPNPRHSKVNAASWRCRVRSARYVLLLRSALEAARFRTARLFLCAANGAGVDLSPRRLEAIAERFPLFALLVEKMRGQRMGAEPRLRNVEADRAAHFELEAREIDLAARVVEQHGEPQRQKLRAQVGVGKQRGHLRQPAAAAEDQQRQMPLLA